jgi:predicted permease
MDFVNLLHLQGQLFLLLVVGVVARRTRLFDEQSKSFLTDFVLYIALPSSIVRSFQMQIDGNLFRSLLSVLVVSMGIQTVSWLFSKLFYRSTAPAKAKVLHYAILISNAGFIGIPIAGQMFGPMGYMYASIYLIPQRVMMWSAGLAIFNPEKASKREAAKKVLLHPCMLAVYVGLFLLISDLHLPLFIENTLDSLGGSTTALSMLLIGTLFAEMGPEHATLDSNLFSFNVIRLGLIPAVTLLGCYIFKVDPLVARVSVVLSAMPGGSSTVVLASKYGGDTIYASKLVVLSTLLSLISISLWALALQ